MPYTLQVGSCFTAQISNLKQSKQTLEIYANLPKQSWAATEHDHTCFGIEIKKFFKSIQVTMSFRGRGGGRGGKFARNVREVIKWVLCVPSHIVDIMKSCYQATVVAATLYYVTKISWKQRFHEIFFQCRQIELLVFPHCCGLHINKLSSIRFLSYFVFRENRIYTKRRSWGW